MLYVVAYDIGDDKRRTRVADELENWGRRVQFSVWECDLEAKQADELIERLRREMRTGDSLRMYCLCATCLEKSVIIGEGGFQTDAGFYQI